MAGVVKKKPVMVYISEDDHRKLKALSLIVNRSISAMMGEALCDYLGKHKEELTKLKDLFKA